MLEPPDLANETIIRSLGASYGIPVVALAFLPIGNDSSAWVYHVRTADGTPYFLKVRSGVTNVLSLVVPRYLYDHGVARVIAPLPTTTHTLWASVNNFALTLYPFVEGRTGMEAGMSEHQWIDYGAILRQIHTTMLTPDLAQLVKRETFTPAWGRIVAELDLHISERTFDDPFENELAAFWRARQAEIRTLVSRAIALGRQLQQESPPLVLCHADVHTGNVLLDAHQQVWIVDWDETTLAPKERDLMFVVGGIIGDLVGPKEEELFLRGYGQTTIDPLALAYYRYAWAVGDIGDYGERVFFMPGVGAETKGDAVQGFKSLFQPGNIVALAYASEGADVQPLEPCHVSRRDG